ncbi:unnamed protein product [Sympodiomycopsis kandeliae]
MPQDVTSREIGKGGFASVKLGQHRGSLVAIKTTVGKESSSARVAARHEAKLLASLKHRHVVHFIAFAERDTISTLTMEYCTGGDLHAFIHLRSTSSRSHGRGMEQHIAAQLIAALHYCHFGFARRYIIHGDIKPANGESDRGLVVLGYCLSEPQHAIARPHVFTLFPLPQCFSHSAARSSWLTLGLQELCLWDRSNQRSLEG